MTNEQLKLDARLDAIEKFAGVLFALAVRQIGGDASHVQIFRDTVAPLLDQETDPELTPEQSMMVSGERADCLRRIAAAAVRSFGAPLQPHR